MAKNFDLAQKRLRELEALIRAGIASPALCLAPAARAYAAMRRGAGAVRSATLLDRLEFWAESHVPDARAADLQRAADEAGARPVLDQADDLGRRLGLKYAVRQRLSIRTIGACDIDKAGRDQLSKQRRRDRERARIEAKRRAAGMVPRKEFLARSLSRTKPWEAVGMSRASWYRTRVRPETGVLQAGETGVLHAAAQAAETRPLPPISPSPQQQTSLAKAADPGARARRTGNRRAKPRSSEPLALAGRSGRRSASAPHSAVASGPPADLFADPSASTSSVDNSVDGGNPVEATPPVFRGQHDGAARRVRPSNGVSAPPLSGARSRPPRPVISSGPFKPAACMYWDFGAEQHDGITSLGRPKGGELVLFARLRQLSGRRCYCLRTKDPKIAEARMRILVRGLMADGQLRPSSQAAKLYGGRAVVSLRGRSHSPAAARRRAGSART